MQIFAFLEFCPILQIFVYLEFNCHFMIKRSLHTEAKQTAREFKILCVTGPRQSGKTTLCKHLFPDKPYVSLEDPDIAEKAQQNGKAFLSQFKNGAIIDEVQRVPHLFNYLQGIVDAKHLHNQFILTGSNNFLLQQNISQSLAGRVGYIELLPFSLNEIHNQKTIKTAAPAKLILNGFYPAVITKKSSPARWYDNYIKTYLEKDVRLLRNIGNIMLFNKFLKLCAARAAQLINVNTLANEVGVDHKTIQAWLSVLESSYIIFFLAPYYNNFNKRVIKSSKLYFYDTGLLCSLLGITTESSVSKSSMYGHLFENFIVCEIRKNRLNKEQTGNMYFIRDSTGNEVDIILEKEEKLLPVEIKSGTKESNLSIKNLKWFQKVFRQSDGILIYGGEKDKIYENNIIQTGWKNVIDL